VDLRSIDVDDHLGANGYCIDVDARFISDDLTVKSGEPLVNWI
jgi:hypothetical protein